VQPGQRAAVAQAAQVDREPAGLAGDAREGGLGTGVVAAVEQHALAAVVARVAGQVGGEQRVERLDHPRPGGARLLLAEGDRDDDQGL
jgi:hypothetical protein